MNTKSFTLALLALLALLAMPGRAAPLGTAFTYQGRLTDGGLPASGSYDLLFRLYDTETGGVPIAPDVTKAPLVIAGGFFSTTLNFGGAAYNGNARWLEIGVRLDGSPAAYVPQLPRQLLTPTPYALFASNAATATSVPWSALTGIPPYIADGDQDTTYSAGAGLTLGGTIFAVDFAGTGSAITAARSDHDHDATFWKLNGNSGTTPGAQFLGTTDLQPLEFKVNGGRALRLEPNISGAPNVIAGSADNQVDSGVVGATIGGGASIQVTTDFGTVGGGRENRSGGRFGTVGGGRQNTNSGLYATVGGGHLNNSGGGSATVSGGAGNVSSGYLATVGGGFLNTSSGENATVPGGSENTAAGNFSFAAGYRAIADHVGSFVWADNQLSEFHSQYDNQFRVRAYNGARFDDGTGLWMEMNRTGSKPIDTSTTAYLSGGGTWVNASDAALKENFQPVDPRKILEQVARIPVSTWNYRAESENIRRLGPTAQDFAAAFGLGADDKHISTVDEGGVALAAIQGLHALVCEKEAQIQSLRTSHTALRQQLEALQNGFADLEKLVSTRPDNQTPGK